MTQGVPDDLLTTPISALFFDRGFLWHYRATVVDIHDGDTLTAEVDTGFDSRHIIHVRIADLDAPELNQPGGKEAWLRLGRAIPLCAWPLRLVSRQRERVPGEVRSFERWVCDVFVLQDDDSLKDVKALVSG